ncbi:MAG: metalloregulator ArsR/SmtB family transcription factor [Thermoplasmata archaeon]|nr:metalloregulator ArsR/SmtB family transcription factor [Thermoplasmata archaeon]
MSEEVCDAVEVHGDRVSNAQSSMPDQALTDSLADFFRIFGDRTRVRILLALDSGEMCVCDISEALGMSMSATSHQLRMLRDAHLVSHRKEGKCVYYSLCDDHVKVVLETALEHVGEADRTPLRNPQRPPSDTPAPGPREPPASNFVARCIPVL